MKISNRQKFNQDAYEHAQVIAALAFTPEPKRQTAASLQQFESERAYYDHLVQAAIHFAAQRKHRIPPLAGR